MGLFKRNRRIPVDVEDGIEYYGNPETDDAIEFVEALRRHPGTYGTGHFVKSRNVKSGRYELVETPCYLRDRKKLLSEGYDLDDLDYAVSLLLHGDGLPRRYRNHKLSGKYRGYSECHVGFDWILLYAIDAGELRLYAVRTGSHKDVLDMRCRSMGRTGSVQKPRLDPAIVFSSSDMSIILQIPADSLSEN